jgi:hypothetical protein
MAGVDTLSIIRTEPLNNTNSRRGIENADTQIKSELHIRTILKPMTQRIHNRNEHKTRRLTAIKS